MQRRPEFKRVYQGGHHDVWCDGTKHVRSDGGWVWPDTPLEQKYHVSAPFNCDCEDWKAWARWRAEQK